MSMLISRLCLSTAALALLAASMLSACSREPDNAVLAEVERDHVRQAAADGRIACALAGAERFRIDCTMDRLVTAEGQTLVLGRADVGYRRFAVTGDGRGLVAADGAEPAHITVLGDGMIEVAVGADRYRLPATIRR